jgi:hypothetical protein
MKVINSSRFIVQIGDLLEYNCKAVDWINAYEIKNGRDPWPFCNKLKQHTPRVKKVKYDFDGMLVWVTNLEKYTGLSGVISGNDTDVWFLNKFGRHLPNCPYPLFIKVRNENQ